MLHLISLFIIPIISMLIGVASLFIDPKSEPKKKWLVIVLLAASTTVAILVSLSDAKEKKTTDVKNDLLQDSVNSLVKHIGYVERGIVGSYAKSGRTDVEVKEFESFMYSDKAIVELIPTVKSQGNTESVTIRYYSKGPNGDAILQDLRDGGLQERNLSLQVYKGNSELASLPTNAMWVGDSVTLEQAKFVALTLSRAGIGVVEIRRFRVSTKENANLIEIGADAALVGKTPKTVDQITSIKVIDRGPN